MGILLTKVSLEDVMMSVYAGKEGVSGACFEIVARCLAVFHLH